jgi:glycyl-tRNA synthetase beta chain
MKGESAVVRSAATYEKTVARLGILLDHKDRRERIRHLADTAAAKEGLTAVDDPELLDELCFMVENPRLLMGGFPEQYLSLPSEVVTTAMRSHQRYIALTGARKKLAPKFITFTDWPVSAPAEVRRGNEKVLRARLEDALFYWREDLKRGVDGLAGELDRIVFIEGLGTIGEKYRRIERLALATNANLETMERAENELVSRAAKLCKADIASEMIKDGKEFTKLQGAIGAHYARESGEDRAVVEAVRDHYLPRTPDDRPPRSTLAALISISDRIDTICGCFLAGFKPTGSQDPYGLRRSANGLIRIIDGKPGVRLDELIDQAIAAYGDSDLSGDGAGARGEVIEFMKGRAEAYLKDHRVPYDVANAVVPVSWVRPGEALRRGRDIAALRGDAVFERLITGVKRVGNIIAPESRLLGGDWKIIAAAVDGGEIRPGHSFDAGLFDDEAEERLAAAVSAAVPALEAAETAGRFTGVLEGLSGLADPIDHYFDTVLVNCDDEAVRANRHRFLAVVYAVFGRYADFSRIVEEGER